jgi:2-polyprenyl-3-methyl-5-hydroxy-6-metoxy-1,4-benzoquinol methylase
LAEALQRLGTPQNKTPLRRLKTTIFDRVTRLVPYDASVSLDRRILVPELMDDPNLDSSAHDHALNGLARLNRLASADLILWRRLLPNLESVPGDRPVRVLDVATGSGDLPIRLAMRARRILPDREITWMGCDISDHALDAAQRRADANDVRFETHRVDITADPLPSADFVICSLFLHHLETPTVGHLLRSMAEATTRTLLVSDLQRTRLGLVLAWASARIFSRSPVVHFDAPASVRAAFTIDELEAVVRTAGLEQATVTRAMPERMLMEWTSSEHRS